MIKQGVKMKSLYLFLCISAFILIGCSQIERLSGDGDLVYFTQVPDAAKPDEIINIAWKVDSLSTNTNLHFDTISHPQTYDETMKSDDSDYKYVSESYFGDKEFSTKIQVPEGVEKIYLRAYARIGGENHWSSERIIEIYGADSAPVKEFIVFADNNGFYPENITVNKDESVKITFHISKENVEKKGLEIASDAWGTTRAIKPGSSKSVEFVAQRNYRFASYIPDSNKLLAIGNVFAEEES